MASMHGRPSTESQTSTSALYRRESPSIEASPAKKTIAQWRSIFSFTRRADLPLLVLAITCSILAGGVAPATSVLTGKIFEGLTRYTAGDWTREKLYSEEIKYIWMLLALAFAKWLIHSLALMLWMLFGERQANTARDTLFHEMLNKEVKWYDTRENGIGALLPRLQAQIYDLQLASAQPLGLTVKQSSEACLQLAQAFYYSWNLTLVTLATTPLIATVLMYSGRRVQAALNEQEQVLSEGQKSTTGAIKAIDTVKCFNGRHIEVEKYSGTIDSAARWYRCVARFAALEMSLVVLLSTCMFAQGFYYGSILVDGGSNTSDEVITTFISSAGAFQALQEILPQMIVLEKGRTAGSSLKDIVAEVTETQDAQDTEKRVRPKFCRGEVELRNLSFAYPLRPEQPALHNVTMSIPAGEMVFLIGESGSGKSTIGQLMVALYSGLSGIYVDKIDLNRLAPDWIRSNITLVEQESILFNDTVFGNIAMGITTDCTDDDIIEAVNFAHLQGMLSNMSDGLETMLGYNGSTVSGGQCQRIALARARLRDTPILILDEITSALDHRTRSSVMDALRSWRVGKTTIVITHDISQIRQDDYLFLLARGKLIEEGYRKRLEKIPDSNFRSLIAKGSDSASCRSHAVKSEDPDHEHLTIQNLSQNRIDQPNFHGHAACDTSCLFPDRRELEDACSLLEGSRTITRVQKECSGMIEVGETDDYGRFLPAQVLPQAVRPMSTSDECLELHEVYRTISDDGNKYDASHDVKATLLPPPKTLADISATAKDRRPEFGTVSYTAILASVWPHLDTQGKCLLLFGFWGATFHAAATPIFSYVLAKLVATYATPKESKREALVYLAAMLAISVLDSIHTYMFRYCLESTAQSWVDSIRREVFKRILSQPQEFFEKQENSVSRLTSHLDHNAEEMRNILGRFLPLVYIATVITLVSIIWTMSVQWPITLVVLCITTCMVLVTRIYSRVSLDWQTLSNSASEAAFAIFTETITKVKTVRTLLLEQRFSRKYIAASRYALNLGFKRSVYIGIWYGASTSIGAVATAVVFYVGICLIASTAAVDDILMVFVMLMISIQVVSEIMEYIPQIGNAQDTASRLLQLTRLPKDSHESWGNTSIAAVGDFVLKDLHYSYATRPQHLALCNINQTIKSGAITALVGGSGSGKSTLMKLLLRLYSTDLCSVAHEGAVRNVEIDGKDVKEIKTSSLRELIVPRTSPMASSYTRFYNGRTSIKTAAQQAGIHDFITSLPCGYDTPIGEGGLGLSGGQAQRIAIARALVRQPAVLVLDEATSALDSRSAAVIRDTLRKLVNDPARLMTVIMVTHDRDMMEIADEIVVLEQGMVVEKGGFGDLMARNGALTALLGVR